MGQKSPRGVKQRNFNEAPGALDSGVEYWQAHRSRPPGKKVDTLESDRGDTEHMGSKAPLKKAGLSNYQSLAKWFFMTANCPQNALPLFQASRQYFSPVPSDK